MKRVALYVRVSTAEQRDHGLSVDSQIEALTQFAKNNNYKIVGIYNDAGISARKDYKHRPGLIQLIKDCNSNKIDMILFTKLDRWFRSVKDYYSVMAQIGDIPWRAIWEDYETETSAGVFKVNIMLSVAQAESDRTSERIRSVFNYQKDIGQYVGTPPMGYKRENKHLVIDEELYEPLRAFLLAYADGRTYRQCLLIANEKGLSFTAKYGYKILNNPAYLGQSANGSICPAYLTEDEIKRFNERKNSRLRTPKNGRVYIFQGLVKCGRCGHTMSCSGQTKIRKDKTEYFYKYYQCKNQSLNYPYNYCKGLTISEEKLEKLVINSIEDQIKNYRASVVFEDAIDDYKKYQAKIEKLRQKLGRIGERYDDGDLSKNEYKRKRDEIKAEIDKLSIIPMPRKAPELPGNWLELYELLDIENKAVFWRKTITGVYFNENRTITIQF